MLTSAFSEDKALSIKALCYYKRFTETTKKLNLT